MKGEERGREHDIEMKGGKRGKKDREMKEISRKTRREG